MELLLSLGPESIWEVGHIVDMVKEMIIYREPTWKMLQSLEKWHDLLKEILQEGHRHKYSDLFWISTVGSTLTEMHKIQKEKEPYLYCPFREVSWSRKQRGQRRREDMRGNWNAFSWWSLSNCLFFRSYHSFNFRGLIVERKSPPPCSSSFWLSWVFLTIFSVYIPELAYYVYPRKYYWEQWGFHWIYLPYVGDLAFLNYAYSDSWIWCSVPLFIA